MKKKILFITPHLSTGGLPQYLLKKIETFKNDFDVYCIEWSNISGDAFVVQRNKIVSLLTNNFFSLPENKSVSLELISLINPDFIHIEEIPETFIDESILQLIYSPKRNYRIVTTTHSSMTQPESIKFTADRFVLVSEWSVDVFRKYFNDSIDIKVWEYPIENKLLNKEEYRKKLGFEEGYKHILNVGLFTPGKNQGELIEIARKLQDWPIKFHFVGNQAINFANYWQPLMQNLPENCIIHGERSNVDDYLAASDLFYFTSNWELNPLVVKEALSFSVPTFIKKLHTYKNFYDGKVDYILTNQDENIQNILKKIFNNQNDIYENIEFNEDIIRLRKPHINCNFIDQSFIEITNTPNERYHVSFIDKSNSQIIHHGEIGNSCWISCSIKYWKDWLIRVERLSNGETFHLDNNLESKRVFICFESSSLGDSLAWIPYVEEFRKKHNCHVVCSTFWNHLFESEYSEIEFAPRGSSVPGIFACYRIGWFYHNGEIDYSRTPTNFRLRPMQQTATDILGLDFVEIKPKVKLQPNIQKEKIVSIAIHGTSQAKYWNHDGGWQKVVDYLKSIDYRVILISREEDGYMGNRHPLGIEKLPHGPIEGVIEILQKSELFIGIGSGLSWLSWAVGTPTVLISGFSYAYTEPSIDVVRIETPIGLCSGCFNDDRLDPGDWNWCPKFKGTDRQFECSRSITSDSVIEGIQKALTLK